MIKMSLYNKIKYGWLFIMIILVAGSGYVGDALTHGNDLKTCLFILPVFVLVMIPNILIAKELKSTKVAKRKFEDRLQRKYHAESVTVDDNLDTVTIVLNPNGKIINKSIYDV